MGTDTRKAGGLTGPALEVIRHPDDRFYELLADVQFAGLIVSEDAGGRYAFIAEGYRGPGGCPRLSCAASWRPSSSGTSP